MAFLFTVEDKSVRPNTETLLISPFKEIWERDETPQKMTAIDELTYIEFMTSNKKSNPYKGYSESLRHGKVKQDIFGQDSYWQPDDLVKAGIKKMEEFHTQASSSYGFLQDAKFAADKLRGFFREFDMNAVNLKTGAPIYKPKDITNALKDTDDVVTKLDKLEKKVEEELFDKVVTKAGKETSPFADPDI